MKQNKGARAITVHSLDTFVGPGRLRVGPKFVFGDVEIRRRQTLGVPVHETVDRGGFRDGVGQLPDRVAGTRPTEGRRAQGRTGEGGRSHRGETGKEGGGGENGDHLPDGARRLLRRPGVSLEGGDRDADRKAGAGRGRAFETALGRHRCRAGGEGVGEGARERPAHRSSHAGRDRPRLRLCPGQGADRRPATEPGDLSRRFRASMGTAGTNPTSAGGRV